MFERAIWRLNMRQRENAVEQLIETESEMLSSVSDETEEAETIDLEEETTDVGK